MTIEEEVAQYNLKTEIDKGTLITAHISDLHFGHKNLLKFTKPRPFTTIEEHDQTIIDNWNSVVKPNDIVFHLGDFMFGNINRFWEYRSRLNGKIYLVHGKVKKILIKLLS